MPGVPYFTLVKDVTRELAHSAFGRYGMKAYPTGSNAYWMQFYPGSDGHIPQQGYPDVGGTQYALAACRDLNLVSSGIFVPGTQSNCFYGAPGCPSMVNAGAFAWPVSDPTANEWCIGWCYGVRDPVVGIVNNLDMTAFCAGLDQSLHALVVETSGHASCPGFDSRVDTGIPGWVQAKHGLGWFCCAVVKFDQQLSAGGCANALAYIAANY